VLFPTSIVPDIRIKSGFSLPFLLFSDSASESESVKTFVTVASASSSSS